MINVRGVKFKRQNKKSTEVNDRMLTTLEVQSNQNSKTKQGEARERKEMMRYFGDSILFVTR